MRKLTLPAALVLMSSVSFAAGCGDSTNGDGDGRETEGIGDGDGDGDGSGDGDGDGDGSGDGDGDGDGDGEENSKWDLGQIPDGANDCGDGGGNNGEPDFSYLWAANSTQGTISKIDTQSVTEVGRFYTSNGGGGDPSRTSVSGSGHVAVANRNSGVTKFYAVPELCDDTNGTPGIQSSTDPNPLAWDQEECRAWHNPFAYYTQRPVAWTQGVFNEGSCQYEDEKLWTSGIMASGGQPEVLLLNGDTGAIEETVQLAGWAGDTWGIYGGAVDGEGNFWGSNLGGSKLVRVDREDFTFQIWDPPNPSGYGMTVDSDGYVWMCSYNVVRFNPQDESWLSATVGGSSGCMADAGDDGLLWVAGGGGVIGVNRETLLVEANWPSNGSYGVSIDFYGYVWAVAFGSNATRVDPATGELTTYAGLVGAYTYSDMTGFALKHAGSPDG